jgi:hypothetical protein
MQQQAPWRPSHGKTCRQRPPSPGNGRRSVESPLIREYNSCSSPASDFEGGGASTFSHRDFSRMATGVASCALALVAWASSSGFAATSRNVRGPGPEAFAHQWSHRFGDSASQQVNDVDFDPNENLAVVGTFAGTVDLGGGPLTANSTDIFVAKFGPQGSHTWSRQFGAAGVQAGVAIASDAAGGVVLAGHFSGVLDFGGGALPSHGADLYVARLDADGDHLWSHSFGDSSQQFMTDVAIDASGNVAITGWLNGSVDFGGGPLSSTSSFDSDAFVAKFDVNGTHEWSRRFGDADAQYGYGVAFDAQGNVVVTGEMAGSADFGGGPLTSAGAQDVFVAKFDAAGNPLWSRRFGDEGWQFGDAVAIDSAGNIVVTGAFYGNIDFGSGSLESTGGDDVYLAKFAPDGASLWSRSFGDSLTEDPFDVAVDPAGNISITGNFQGQMDFGSGLLSSAGSWDVYVAKFSPGGAHLWSTRFGDSDTQYALCIAASLLGDIAVGGWFKGSVDFGGGPLTSAGGSDAFVAKLADPPPTAALPPFTGSRLAQNRPNPFNPVTMIDYELEHPGPVLLQVRDASGRHVITLVNCTLPAGRHVAHWDGTNERGARVASGAYFYTLTAGRFVTTRKLVVLK